MEYEIDPPCYYELHYTEVVEYRTEYANDWAWPRLVVAMPELLAAGCEGKYAVVTVKSVTVAEEWTEVMDACGRLGGAKHARCYRIQERIKFGRTYPRLRRVSREPVPPLPPVDQIPPEEWVEAILTCRQRTRSIAS